MDLIKVPKYREDSAYEHNLRYAKKIRSASTGWCRVSSEPSYVLNLTLHPDGVASLVGVQNVFGNPRQPSRIT